MVTPGRKTRKAVTHTPLPIVTGRAKKAKAGSDQSWLPVNIFTPWLRHTFEPIVTGHRLSIHTPSPSQTWSPTDRNHGYLMFTQGLQTKPFPMVAPKARSSNAF